MSSGSEQPALWWQEHFGRPHWCRFEGMGHVKGIWQRQGACPARGTFLGSPFIGLKLTLDFALPFLALLFVDTPESTCTLEMANEPDFLCHPEGMDVAASDS